MNKKKQEHTPINDAQIDEKILFERVSAIIENRKYRATVYANSEVTLMFWEIGHYVNSVMLESKRAAYGKQIVATLSPQLSWSHIIELLPLETTAAKLFYAKDAIDRRLGVRELRKQISRKAYERQEIANSHLPADSTVPFNVFKDPYLLDIFGLKENFLEADLEKAILTELEKFILEFGHGFTFVERQKRITMDGDDYTLDLLFFHRILKRLVAIELKIGKFVPQYKGQMEFYLRWLNKYERQTGENEPIGLILCTKASRNQIELMELDKSGIAVAEYWTDLPPKAVFEQKIKKILDEAQERLERRKSLRGTEIHKQINHFYEPKDQ